MAARHPPPRPTVSPRQRRRPDPADAFPISAAAAQARPTAPAANRPPPARTAGAASRSPQPPAPRPVQPQQQAQAQAQALRLHRRPARRVRLAAALRPLAVQLGAFSNEANARRAWSAVGGRLGRPAAFLRPRRRRHPAPGGPARQPRRRRSQLRRRPRWPVSRWRQVGDAVPHDGAWLWRAENAPKDLTNCLRTLLEAPRAGAVMGSVRQASMERPTWRRAGAAGRCACSSPSIRRPPPCARFPRRRLPRDQCASPARRHRRAASSRSRRDRGRGARPRRRRHRHRLRFCGERSVAFALAAIAADMSRPGEI